MRTWIVAFAMVAPLASLAAQALAVGDRIRLTVAEPQPQQESPGSRRLVLRGEVTRLVPDSIYLRPSPVTSELSIPVVAVKSLQRSRGVSRSATALRLAFVLAATTALYSAGVHDDDRPLMGADDWRDAALAGAAIGAGTGLILGVVFPTEGWRRLKNWNR